MTANVCIGFVSTWELSGTTLKYAALKSLMAGTASNSCFFINNCLYPIVFFCTRKSVCRFFAILSEGEDTVVYKITHRVNHITYKRSYAVTREHKSDDVELKRAKRRFCQSPDNKELQQIA